MFYAVPRIVALTFTLDFASDLQNAPTAIAARTREIKRYFVLTVWDECPLLVCHIEGLERAGLCLSPGLDGRIFQGFESSRNASVLGLDSMALQ